jgi:hypothetical protein
MTDAALLFAATFGVVFALGLQSLNVNGGHKALAFVTSFLIGASNLVLFKVLPRETSVLEIAAYLMGGPFGIVASMWAHPWLVRLHAGLQRLGLRLQAVSPAEAEAQVAAAFAAPEPLAQVLTPSPAAAALRATTLASFGGLSADDSVTPEVRHPEHHDLRQLARDLLDPDMYGHAVTPEVRDRARGALGMSFRETARRPESVHAHQP